VISEPLSGAASTTSTPRDSPEMIRLRRGKVGGDGRRAERKFGNDGAAFGNRQRQFLIAGGVEAVGARADDGDGFATGGQRAAMGGGIDAEGEAADDAQAGASQRFGEISAVCRPCGVALRLPTIPRPRFCSRPGLPRT
jgi:hypothetical protein